MERPRVPTAVRVIAVLNFIYGGFRLLCGLGGLILLIAIGGDMSRLSSFAPGAQAQQQMEKEIEVRQRVLDERVPFNKAFRIEAFVAGPTFAVLMIVAGAGLLRLRPWARALSLVYAAADVVQHLVAAFLTIVYISPANREAQIEAMRQMPNANSRAALAARSMAEASGGLTAIVSAIAFLLFLAYPVIVLVIMLLPSVRAAFAGRPVPRKGSEDSRGPVEGDGPDERVRGGDR